MPRGRHRHSPPLHRLLPPSAIAGVSVVCALGPWVVTAPLVLRSLAAAAAVTAVAGAIVLRRWDTQAGRRVADLTRARASDEWRFEERVAELESDLDESRELRGRLEQKLRAKRTELAGLRNEHAALLRRYATAETERASALEGRRLLELEAGTDVPALPAGPTGAVDGGRADSAESAESVEPVGDQPADVAPAVFSAEGARLFQRAGAALARLAASGDDRTAPGPSGEAREETGGKAGAAPAREDGPQGKPEAAAAPARVAAALTPGEPEQGETAESAGEPERRVAAEPGRRTEPGGTAAPAGEADQRAAAESAGEPEPVGIAGPGRGTERREAAEPGRETERGGTVERAGEAEQGATAERAGEVEQGATAERAGQSEPDEIAESAGEPERPETPGPTRDAEPVEPVAAGAAGRVAQPSAGHFTVPTAVAVVPAAPVRRPVTGGGFDFFGTKKEEPSADLEAVQNEDLADVVGQEALALHKAESESAYRPAGPVTDARAVGQVIDLTAHDETEQLDVLDLRTAAS
ncbi:hypothetical protein ABZ858_30510 [Streptomyces sp. NPDC047017]|uniref:hypothetical protein n=1 Tax=Streptomyces sp. NPDC047017 TaxID=3155024 RepID=UPI0033D0C75F